MSFLVKKPEKGNSRIDTLQVQLNRLQSKKALLQNRLKQALKSERKARTRTLIQMGGLVTMIGLSDLCDIREGEDLQLDINALDKAAVLLGILEETLSSLPSTLSEPDLERFKQIGIRRLKMQRGDPLPN